MHVPGGPGFVSFSWYPWHLAYYIWLIDAIIWQSLIQGHHKGISTVFLYYKEPLFLFSTSVVSSSPTGVTVGNRRQRKRWQEGRDASVVTVGLIQPQMLSWWQVRPSALQHVQTTWLYKVPEFKLLGVEVFEAKRKIYRIWIICYCSASVKNELAKQSLKFPTEHLK